MLSNLLINFVKENTICQLDVGHENLMEDAEAEPMPLKIQTNNKGELIETHQIHHYWYRDDSLKEMVFYDFCRFISLEEKSKSDCNKNTFKT